MKNALKRAPSPANPQEDDKPKAKKQRIVKNEEDEDFQRDLAQAIANSLESSPKYAAEASISSTASSSHQHQTPSTKLFSKTFYLNKTSNHEGRAITLKDLLSAGETPLRRVVLSTYTVDLGWLFLDAKSTTSPSKILNAVEEIVVVHGSSELQKEYTRVLSSEKKITKIDDDLEVIEEESETLSRLLPMFKKKQLQLHFPRLPIEYGTQHGKFLLMYYEDSIRIAITTANLYEPDWTDRIQCIWTESFKKKQGGSSKASEFEMIIVDYMKQLGLKDESRLLAQFDYSTASVRLVTSVPGYHSGKTLNSYGHMRLRTLLKENCLLSEEQHRQYSGPVCLFSSSGSLTEKWLLEEFNNSFLAHKDTKQSKQTLQASSTALNPLLVWPTMNEVANSRFGFQGSGHYCFYKKNMKPFMQSCLYKFQPFPKEKSALLSHAKVYFRYKITKPENAGEDSRTHVPWFLVTSSNLSKAAWGTLMKNNTTLMIRSFELGVLFLPKPNETFITARFPDAPTSTAEKTESQTEPNAATIRFPVPLKLPLHRHEKGEHPFFSDGSYSTPDLYGVIMDNGILKQT